MSQLANALFTTTQQNVLKLLYTQTDKSFYTKEILHLTGMGVATIKRELDRMVGAGILKTFKIGNQIHYQANQNSPIYHALHEIVNKTFGVRDVIKAALEPVTSKIIWCFIFGSIASGKESQSSDIDLLIVASLSFTEVVKALYGVQDILGREINPKIYSEKEWKQMLIKKDGFIKDVLKKPRIDVIGDGNEFK